jgi:putative oxidoreductase
MFMKGLERYTYALLRIMSGFMFAAHGGQKLLSFPAPSPDGAPWFVIYVAGSVELFGGLLVMLGLFTPWAAFLASGVMASAYWMAHGSLSASLDFFPLVNHGEAAALYCFIFLFLSSRGSGVWSLDALLGRAGAGAHAVGARG